MSTLQRVAAMCLCAMAVTAVTHGAYGDLPLWIPGLIGALSALAWSGRGEA